ncbi:toxin ParE1/3/4 [Sphingobium faniae]|uniref:type II toxin-antitoxin system RelE/ParE family toxin n=1 Tax=Rhizorhapis sp. SPR117 TaxID=2912611 RepID=UPI0008773FCD|nr:type II toxin-antitoxin system RelE/ParE family toxin [Rhizorhapis sp. SPR117]SCW89162.1 toxin ParE1/3/4 [Sphingobium faniae]
MTRIVRLAGSARADILDILERSEAEFGAEARVRYERLISAALHDLSAAPERPGSAARPELGADLRTWHLRGSRERARGPDGTVRRPRHLLLYTIIDDRIVGVLRVLHDAVELHRHLQWDDEDAAPK